MCFPPCFWGIQSENSFPTPGKSQPTTSQLIIFLSTDEKLSLSLFKDSHEQENKQVEKFFVAPEEIKLWITTAKS